MTKEDLIDINMNVDYVDANHEWIDLHLTWKLKKNKILFISKN